MNPTIFVIGGPTAVGKTDLSLTLASWLGAEIISCDSRQCYREMSIGTAKPSAEELNQIRHHFINSHSIQDTFTAGDFYRQGRALLKELFHTSSAVLVTGGSGLYLNALLNGIDQMPEIDPIFRKTLNARFQEDGLSPLTEELKKVDPLYHSTVDLKNPQRVIRALEVFQGTGKPFSSFQRSESPDPLPYDIVSVGLDRPREELYDRINSRVDHMMAGGLVDEVKSLLPFREHYALQTVGYKEIFQYLDGNTSLDQAIALVKQNTRRYAKRQLTWFKKYGNMRWFLPENTVEIEEFITRMTQV